MVDVGKLRKEERISLELSLYFKNRGFEEYKMGAFEEYSVYMDNKDFLLNKNMAVFAGLDGKLYALRPDVTLSVVKNARVDGGRAGLVGAADDVLRLHERRELTISFHYPEEAGNGGQAQYLSFDLKADAVQTKNNPNRLFE